MRDYSDRKFVLMAVFLITALAYILRLSHIQLIDDSYKLSAKNQSLRYVTRYPVRGLIYDRNAALLVYNEAAYDLMVVPGRVVQMDTVQFCNLLHLTKQEFLDKLKKASDYSKYKSSVFIRQIPLQEFSSFSEHLYKFPGFFGQERTLRKYPRPIAAHILGYISEVDKKTLESDHHYKSGEYKGFSGIELQYEEILRGRPGTEVLVVDVHNAVQGSYKEGIYDTLPEDGSDISLTIQMDLQAYGEKLMQNKKGSIVAIEPSTGDILCMISSPGYDPNLLVGRKRSKNYQKLAANDSLKPLFNRAMMAQYPPGSIFKLVQALIGLQEGVISENTSFACDKTLLGCHHHPKATGLIKGIQFSCNPYFYNVFHRIIQRNRSGNVFADAEINYKKWYKHVLSFGFGRKLGIDFPVEKSGIVPRSSYYDKIYGRHRWAFTTIYSLGIGQGELETVPLQMANLAAIIANRGYYFIPHFILKKEREYRKKMYTTVKPAYFDLVREAMRKVVEEPHGTARRARIPGIVVCGKTGTAQNPHGEDHSAFIAFAPKEDAKIAIAVYVENAGFGGTWAAPIASLMIEKYLRKSISDTLKEQYILQADFIHHTEDETE